MRVTATGNAHIWQAGNAYIELMAYRAPARS